MNTTMLELISNFDTYVDAAAIDVDRANGGARTPVHPTSTISSQPCGFTVPSIAGPPTVGVPAVGRVIA